MGKEGDCWGAIADNNFEEMVLFVGLLKGLSFDELQITTYAAKIIIIIIIIVESKERWARQLCCPFISSAI